MWLELIIHLSPRDTGQPARANASGGVEDEDVDARAAVQQARWNSHVARYHDGKTLVCLTLFANITFNGLKNNNNGFVVLLLAQSIRLRSRATCRNEDTTCAVLFCRHYRVVHRPYAIAFSSSLFQLFADVFWCRRHQRNQAAFPTGRSPVAEKLLRGA